jgi:acyl-homoserine-lactone acylase
MTHNHCRSIISTLVIAGGIQFGDPAGARAQSFAPELWRQVEIIRTAHGVPHIRAENLRAAGYGLGWIMLEDYGARTPLFVLRARGEMGRLFGHDSIESDFMNRIRHERAVVSYYRLEKATRDVYEGFAAGMNPLHRAAPP